MSTQLRQVTRAELPLLLQGLRGLADFECKLREFSCTEAWLEKVIFGPDHRLGAHLLWCDEQCVGIVTWYDTIGSFRMSKNLFVEDLYIWPEFRRRGYCKQLMLQLKAWSVQLGYSRLEWKVLHWNMGAQQFYKALGSCEDREFLSYIWK